MATPTTLYEYYTQKGQALPSVQDRSKIFEQYGLGSASIYKGTAEQNIALLGKLLTPTPAPVPAPSPTPFTPAPTPTTPVPAGLAAFNQQMVNAPSTAQITQKQYQYQPGESTAQYNAKIAALRGETTPKLSTDVFPTPPGPAQPLKWEAGPTPTPSPTPSAGGTPASPTPTPPNQAAIDAAVKAANDQAKSFLDSITTKDVETRKSSEILAKIASSIETTAPPAPQSMASLFNEQKSKLGLDVLETKLADLDSEIDRVNTNLLVESEKAGQELVSMREITRTRGSLQMEAQQRIALLQVERNAVARQTSNKLDTLKMVMDYTGQDFTNASNYYTQIFNRNVQLYNLVKGVEESQKTEIERATDNARANVNTLVTTLKDAGVDYLSMSADQRLTAEKLTIQAGLPSGFVALALSGATKKIQTILTSPDRTQMTYIYEDGSMETKPTGFQARPGFQAKPGSDNKAVAYDAIKQRTIKLFADGATQEEYQQMRQEIINMGLGSYLDNFDKFATPYLPAEPISLDKVKSTIIDTLRPQKDVYSRDEAKTMAENQLSTALKLKTGQTLPEAYSKVIEDALTEVYGAKKPWYQFW